MGRQCGLPQCDQIFLCFLFIIIVSNVRFHANDFTVPLWGSEVANSKTEIHLTNTAGEVSMRCYICDVTTVEREGDYTSLDICHCVL